MNVSLILYRDSKSLNKQFLESTFAYAVYDFFEDAKCLEYRKTQYKFGHKIRKRLKEVARESTLIDRGEKTKKLLEEMLEGKNLEIIKNLYTLIRFYSEINQINLYRRNSKV